MNASIRALTPFALLGAPLISACFGMAGVGGTGGYTLVDGKAMSKVEAINDPALRADAERLEGKSLQPGTGDYYAGLCLQGYINGRFAELAIDNSSDEAERRRLEGELVGGFGTCASNCQTAQQQGSSYSNIATRLEPMCSQGMAAQRAAWSSQGLAKSVETFLRATEPLALYFARRDSQALLTQAQAEAPEDPQLSAYQSEIAQLSKKNARAIQKGQAFFEGPSAQKNFSKRELVQSEIEALRGDIAGIERSQESLRANGSLDSHMESRQLDDQIQAKRRVLAGKTDELSRLQKQYTKLAVKAGVVKPR